MPGVSGLDLAGDFDREYPRLKILFISGYTASIVTDALQHRSPDRILLKPFTERTLIGRVRLLLTARRETVSETESAAPKFRSGTLG